MVGKLLPSNYMSGAPLSILKVIGEDMHYSWKLLNVERLFNVMAISTVACFIVCGAFKEKKSERYIQYMESFSMAIHMEFKYLFFIYNKPLIRKILSELAQIHWNSNDFTEDFLAFDLKFQKLIRMVVHHPFETWEPDSIMLATIILALQYYVVMLLPLFIIICDCLYLALCAEIVIQIRRLRHRMQRLFVCVENSLSIRDELCRLIRYHEHLLRIFRQMQEIYSFTLLFHYFITLSSNCAELYTLLRNSKFDAERLMGVIAIVSQFAFYTFPAEAITTEFENISTALYMSDWYKSNLDCQKLVLFSVMRGQLRQSLLGGGMIEINLRAFTSVLKLSFSVYTLLKNMVYS